MNAPTAPAEEISDFARRDLALAVSVVLERDGHLLSAGEGVVARAWLGLSEAASSLYARLFSRRPRIFWLEEIQYKEVEDLPAATAELLEAGFAWDAGRLAPAGALAEATTVAGLKAAAAALGRPRSGLRADLVARLSDPAARAALARPGLWLRHCALFRRFARLYLHEHDGDLSRLVVSRLGLVQPPPYTPTGGEGLFPRRAALLAYEEALAQRAETDSWDLARWTAEGERATARIEATPMEPDWRFRFSARRFDEGVALAAARLLERVDQPERAESLYDRLLRAGIRDAGEAVQRHALCLEALGRASDGAQACARRRGEVDPSSARAVDRTGRRLARKAGLPWAPLPPLAAPFERLIRMEAAGAIGNRPGWRGDGEARTVEGALAALVTGLGREVHFGENELWSSLFGVLFREILFSPVPGMLPTPLLTGPLDLGTPGFFERRRAPIEALLAALAAGEGPDRVRAESCSFGLAISGVRWDRFNIELLASVAEGVGPAALSALMRFFAEDWRGSHRGLPDLVVLPGPACSVPEALPAALSPELVLVEVKGPTDSQRDSQRVWFDRLLGLGLRVELWWVERT